MSVLRTLLAVSILVVAVACGGGDGGSPNPANPVPTPTPTPVPTPTPNPYAAACGTPLPPLSASYGFGIKVQLEPSRNRKVLNASPLVNSAEYCGSAGLPGSICNSRFEDNPQRVPCDYYLAGMSQDGRPGPDWYKEEADGTRFLCGSATRAGQTGDCSVREENQFLLNIQAHGKYVACGGQGSNGSCGQCVVYEEDWGVIHRNPAGLCHQQ
jgi:hypothetical protein